MASFGEILKRERELRGISLREISAATKISTRHLEALEESRIGALPGGLFNKGFIRAYALHVGIDPEEMVNNYLYDVGQMEAEDPLEAVRALVPPERRGAAVRWRQWGIIGAILAGGVLLFVVLSLSFRSPDTTDRPIAAAAAAAPEPAAANLPTATIEPEPVGTETDLPIETPPLSNPEFEPEGGDEPPQQPGAGREPPPPPQSAAATPALPTRNPVSLPPAATPTATDLRFELEMRHAARVRIVCDGNEVLNKRLTAGERRRFTCQDLEFSTSDSASFRYRVNDDDWVIPGVAGRPLDGVQLTPSAGGAASVDGGVG